MTGRSLSFSFSVSFSWALAIFGCLAVLGCASGDSSPDTGAGTGGAHGGSSGTGSGGAGGTATTGSGGAGEHTGIAGSNGSGGDGATGNSSGAGGASKDGGAGAGGQGGESTGGGGGARGVAGQSGSGGGSGHAGNAGGSAGAGGHAGTTGGSTGAGGLSGSTGAGGQAGGAAGMGPEAPGGRVSGYGTVSFTANSKNEIVRLQTTLTVPAEPPASGTLFLWPGLQPNGADFDPIGNGVLQPVLTWGNSCAPGTQPRAYSTWWISAQYVNTDGSDPGYMGCYGGAVMSVKVGDELNIDMQLAGTVWTQTVTDDQSGQSVNFSFDMMNQTQNIAYFVIEEYSSAPVSEVIFTSTTLTFASADAGDCKLAMRGQTDFVSVPVASSDGLQCAIQQIILRAQGIQ